MRRLIVPPLPTATLAPALALASVLASVLTPVLTSCGPSPEATAWREGLGASEERSPEDEAALHPVHIHEPPELTRLSVREGGPGVLCSTCHGLEELAPEMPTTAADASGPHVGLRLAHGSLACASCHASEDVTALHLADGRTIPMREAMTLCAQCHGPQFRDYQHGSHGGMRGYWDRTRGERQRNHCVDCHDPHAPAFGTYLPMPAPRDRVRPVSAHPAGAAHAGAAHE